MMFLPGVMGRFLSYIPITVFTTLLAALILSLTISSALFIKFTKEKKTFAHDEKLEATMTLDQITFLKSERKGKIEIRESKI